MAIQLRRGEYADFDKTKMLSGELAVVQSGDETTSTGKGVYACFSPGDVQRLSTYEEVEAEIEKAIADLDELTDIIEEILEEHPEWTTTIQDGAVTDAKLARAIANNLTTATPGTTLLDGYQGKVLKDSLDTIESNIQTIESEIGTIEDDLSDLGDTINQYRVYRIEAGPVSSLPFTITNSVITHNMTCLKAELTNWAAMGSDWTVTTGAEEEGTIVDGTATISGTIVSGQTTNVTLWLVEA